MYGKKIEYFRKIKGFSQRDLAKKVNKSNTYISQIENNKTIPNDELLEEISEVLGVDVDFIKEYNFTIDDELVGLLIELTKRNKINWNIVKKISDDGLLSIDAVVNINNIRYNLYLHEKDNKIQHLDFVYTDKNGETLIVSDKLLELKDIILSQIKDDEPKSKQIDVLKRLLEE